MARKIDKIVVVDIEATCWDGDPPRGQESEIIEIGACLLDPDDTSRSCRTSILVKPERSTAGEFCTGLTTITQGMLDDEGIPFASACDMLRNSLRTHRRVWASYGDYDRTMFEKQCKARGIPYPFGRTHINVKALAGFARAGRTEFGLDKAMRLMLLQMEGTHHRGADDAWNIAAVLGELIGASRSAFDVGAA